MANKSKSAVLNNSLGSHYPFGIAPNFSSQDRQNLLAEMFEQLMIFDTLTLTANKTNLSLQFLLAEIGVDSVERLLEPGSLRFILWSPIVLTSTGKKKGDGTIDETSVLGQPPFFAGSLTDKDLDPEYNLKEALRNSGLEAKKKRSFIKKAIKAYSVPDGMHVTSEAYDLVIDSYKNNDLEYLGLPMTKEPEQMTIEERGKLLDLSHSVIEIAILSQYGLKSYEN